MRLIDADKLSMDVKTLPIMSNWGEVFIPNLINEQPTIDAIPMAEHVENLKPADVVSRGLFDQIRWERDIAIDQLDQIGKTLGEKMDNVASVVRCKDCKFLMLSDCYGECRRGHFGIVTPNDYCSRGTRKDDEIG